MLGGAIMASCNSQDLTTETQKTTTFPDVTGTSSAVGPEDTAGDTSAGTGNDSEATGGDTSDISSEDTEKQPVSEAIDLSFSSLDCCSSKYAPSYSEGVFSRWDRWFSTEYIDISGYYGLSYELASHKYLISLSFYDAASYNTGIRYYTKGEPKPEGVEKGVQLAFYDFTHRLTGKAQEAALAQLFLEDELQQRYDMQLLPLADEFHRLYSESGWMPWVDRAVAKNRAFNETTIPTDIHFPDISSAKTLKDVTDRYKGKVIFMDIWATWCGPCRETFARMGSLQEYAAANDVVLLYLSIDHSEDDEKWRKMAVHYNLKGEHICVQEAFKQEIYDTFGHKGALNIPRCVIFDKQGNIRFSTAASPEQWDRLKEQLQEAAQ